MTAGSPFVGRRTELAEVGELLGSFPVVTITGPGGIGKTRLASEVADRMGETFTGGTPAADLATVGPDDDVADAIARQLAHESIEAVRVAAIGRPTLVIIDDCERMLDQVRTVVADLVGGDADLVVLATSRAPLDLVDERRYHLEPLDTTVGSASGEGSHTEAVQLFLDRADSVGASWPRSPENLGAVHSIVERLDGMPLAIELAAARSRATSPGELAPLLDRQLDLLRRSAPRAGERHGSIRGVIDASYEPLSPEQQRMFRRLSHIPERFDLDLAHRVAGIDDDTITTLELLTDLTDRSLVTAVHGEDGLTRYRLLEPIRAYGREQLAATDEITDVEDLYIAAVTAFADEVVAEAIERFSADVLDRIAARYAHLLQAIDSCINHDPSPDRAYRLFLPLYAPTSAPRTEVARLGSRVLERWPGTSAPLRAEALAVMAHTSMFAGHDEDAIDQATAALDHPDGTPLARTIAERVLGYVSGRAGDRTTGLQHLEAAMTEAESLGGGFARELRLSWAAMVDDPARRQEALGVLDTAAADAAEQDETVTLVWAAVAIAHQQVLAGDLDAATRAADRAMDLAGRTLAPWPTAAAHRAAAAVSTLSDDWNHAARSWTAALDQVVAVGDIGGITLTLRDAASAAEFAGQGDIAQRLWQTVPPQKGASTLVPLFADEEDRLRNRWGPPVPMPLTQSIRRGRELLAGADPQGEGQAEVDAPGTARPATTLRFDRYEIDLEAHELRHDGERVHTEPQVFDVLTYLARNAGRMVSRDELLDEVWGDRFVSPSALSSRIKSARSATGDDGRAQQVIRTVHGKGFMFVAELR